MWIPFRKSIACVSEGNRAQSDLWEQSGQKADCICGEGREYAELKTAYSRTEPNRIYGSEADRKPIGCVGEGREYAELIIGGQRI